MDQGNFKRPVGSLHFISESLNSAVFFFIEELADDFVVVASID